MMKDSGEVSRGEKMLYAETDPESYITEYTLVYGEEDCRDASCSAYPLWPLDPQPQTPNPRPQAPIPKSCILNPII